MTLARFPCFPHQGFTGDTGNRPWVVVDDSIQDSGQGQNQGGEGGALSLGFELGSLVRCVRFCDFTSIQTNCLEVGTWCSSTLTNSSCKNYCIRRVSPRWD